MRGHSLAGGLRDAAAALRDGGRTSDAVARCLDALSDGVERFDARQCAVFAAVIILVGVAAASLYAAVTQARFGADDVELPVS